MESLYKYVPFCNVYQMIRKRNYKKKYNVIQGPSVDLNLKVIPESPYFKEMLEALNSSDPNKTVMIHKPAALGPTMITPVSRFYDLVNLYNSVDENGVITSAMISNLQRWKKEIINILIRHPEYGDPKLKEYSFIN